MKNIKNIIVGMMVLVLFHACSEDNMDKINENVNNPSNVPARFILTDVMTASAFTITGSDYSFYAGVYAELNAGVDNQMYQAQVRNGEPQLSSTYNNAWNSSYRQLKSLKIVIDKCSAGGEEEGNYQTLGVAQILYAYNLAILTDLFGDVPNSEALQLGVIFQPNLDKQEKLYNEVFRLLKESIDNLNKVSLYDDLGRQDLIYRAVAKKEVRSANWIKVANGLLARYTMRLSFRQSHYTAVIDYVNASFSNANEEFKFVNPQVPNPFARFDANRGGLATSKSFYNIMLSNGASDIRTATFFTKIEGVVVPFDNSLLNPREGQGIYSKYAIMSELNPIYLLSYHELIFLKAEAQARLGQDVNAQLSLNKGIKAAYMKQYAFRFTAAQADTYIATIGTLTGNNLLKKIMIEKYISFYENEGIEVYNDIRRLKAMGNADLIPLVNPQPDKFPKRFSYGNSDVSANPNIKEAFGDGSYVYSEDVWWAGGTR